MTSRVLYHVYNEQYLDDNLQTTNPAAAAADGVEHSKQPASVRAAY